jgi:hypothetical protein
MGIMRRLDKRGDGEIATWGEDRRSQRAAERIFNRYIARGYRIADISGDQGFMNKFDPNTSEMLIMSRMVAG